MIKLYCPRHPNMRITQIRLDVWGCPECGRAWLIHKLSEKYPAQ